MASISGDLGPSDDALPPTDQSNSAVVGTHTTNDLDTASRLCFDCAPDPPPPWTNVNNAYDVDGDGEVTPSDALVILNYLNTTGPGPVPSTAPAVAPYLDTTGDNHIAPDDVMAVLNKLRYLNLVDKINRFREAADRKFQSSIPLDITDLQVIERDPSEMPYQSDGISYWDLPFVIPSVSTKVYDAQFPWGSWEEAERTVDELLSKVVDDRPSTFFGS